MRGGEIISNLHNRERGYLVGLFLGDGYSHHDKKNRHYTVEFYLNSIRDKDIQKYLIKLLKRMNLNPAVFKDKRYNCNKTRVRSKEFFSYVRNFKFKRNKEFNMGLVSGLIDSDGYVNFEKSYIQIINTNKQLLDKIKLILDGFNINSSIKRRVKSRKDKLKSYKLSISFKFIKTSNNSIKVKRIAGWSKVPFV